MPSVSVDIAVKLEAFGIQSDDGWEPFVEEGWEEIVQDGWEEIDAT